ncbi:hypothetical protein BC832DRAFT_384516 [Gaertneriomyces semiglobifer]|nr:hypothetical protein BC832DRAFT_384516 [Gaertneriomyces semiglobifer]
MLAPKPATSAQGSTGEKVLAPAVDLAQVRKSLLEGRAAIENLEKAFRENASIKRLQFQPYTIFSPDLPSQSLGDEAEYAREMIERAKDLLMREGGEKRKGVEMQANVKLDAEERIRTEVTKIREIYRTKEQLLQAGPRLLQYFSSTCGNILHIHMISDALFVVFTEGNYIEFWNYSLTPPSTAPTLLQIVQLDDLAPCSVVCDMLTQDITPRPVASQTNSPSASRDDLSQVSTRRQSLDVSQLERRNSVNAKGGSLWAGGQRQRMPMPAVVAEEDEAAASEVEGLARPSITIARESVITGPEEEDEVVNQPVTMTRHAFFLGCNDGVGAVLNIDVHLVKESGEVTYTHEIAFRRQLSVRPIVMVTYSHYSSTLTAVVHHTPADFSVAGYTQTLEDEWQCRGETIRVAARDRMLKVIAQTRFDVVHPENATEAAAMENDPEEWVTSIKADEIARQVLVAVRSGGILRLNCETVVVNRPTTDTAGAKLESDKDPSAPTGPGRRESVAGSSLPPRKDLFVSWILDVQSLPTTRSLRLVRGPPLVIKQVQTYSAAKPYLLVSGSDSALRLYPTDQQLSTAQPIVCSYSDQEDGIVISAETWGSWIVGYTSDGIFLIYSTPNPAPLVERRVHSSRFSFLRPSNMAPNTPYTPHTPLAPATPHTPHTPQHGRAAMSKGANVSRRCLLVQREKGVCALIAGREWTIVDLGSVKEWNLSEKK